MTHHHVTRRSGLLSLAVAAALFGGSPAVVAQSASATLRGQIDTPTATIKVTNSKTGYSRTVQSENGNYSVSGLPPGTYDVQVDADGQQTQRSVVLRVGETSTLDLELAPAAVETTESVTVVATHLYETKTSEVGNYVSQRQIEMLPQNSRNFLAFADTIPGVQFVTSSDGSTELRSGSQSSNGVNVFIDGVGQKNYVLRGGVGGQTNSRGNPFPQLAIGEYKVLTSNYKAELDQLSSAAVIAVTRSGTNEFESHGFWDKTSEKWREPDPLEEKAGRKAESEQQQYGVSFGGPIIRDRMHFFVAYEAKDYKTPQTVSYGEGTISLSLIHI